MSECLCKRVKCERHGNCAECRKHHEEKNSPTSCDRIKLKQIRIEERKNKRKK